MKTDQDVQDDLSLCWAFMYEGTFSDVAAHFDNDNDDDDDDDDDGDLVFYIPFI